MSILHTLKPIFDPIYIAVYSTGFILHLGKFTLPIGTGVELADQANSARKVEYHDNRHPYDIGETKTHSILLARFLFFVGAFEHFCSLDSLELHVFEIEAFLL